MSAERRVWEARALLAAAATGAALVGAAAIHSGPRVFAPYPLALATFALAGLAGALSSWVMAEQRLSFPLALLLLPVLRLVLFFVRHGMPPWAAAGWDWLLGDDFPWWGVAAFCASCYAGSLTAGYVRIQPRSRYVARPSATDARYQTWMASRLGEEDRAQLQYQGISRLFTGTVALGASCAAVTGRPVGFLVMCCTACFLACALYFLGLAYARRMAVAWLEQGVEAPADGERWWWRGHAKLFWPIFLVLPFLPGGFRPVRLEAILQYLPWYVTRPPRLDAMRDATAGQAAVPPQAYAHLRWLDRVVGFISVALQFLLFAASLVLVLAAALFVLRELVRLLASWLRGLGPVWRAVGRFLAALAGFLRETLDAGVEALRPGRGRASVRVAPLARPPAFSWPGSPVRRLFARLVLWGRGRGFVLRRSMTPTEISQGLAAIVPGCEEDLGSLTEGYRRERYGGVDSTPREREIYRAAWRRIVAVEPVEGTAVEGDGARGAGEDRGVPRG